MSELANRIQSSATVSGEPQKGETVADLLERQKVQIARALPAHLDADRFARIVLTECKRTPKLLECTPASLLAACMLAAQLGLEPGPLQRSYLVPRTIKGRPEVQFQIGYRGYLDLARRSGEISGIEARTVYSGDEFDFAYGLSEHLTHKPALSNHGDAIAYYGIARYKDGGHYMLVMSPYEVEERRKRSATPKNGPWVTDFDAMARKTIIRAMAPYLPQSIEFAQALEADESVPASFDETLIEDQPALEVPAEPQPEEAAQVELGENE